MEVEGAAIEALVQLVMRLSETLFRPLFLKTFDWALTLPEEPFYALTLQAPAKEEEDEEEANETGATSQVDLYRSLSFYWLMNQL